MADAKISALTDGTTADSADKIPVERSGANRYITPAYIRTLFLASSISDSDATHAPDGNSVFDALALKAPLTPSVNPQTGTTYTLQASDNGKVVTLSNASGITVTVPSGLGAGFNCLCVQIGAGQVSFTASSTTINNRQSHTKIAGQYGEASLVAYVSDVFVLAGDTAA